MILSSLNSTELWLKQNKTDMIEFLQS
jgi:hypothetical protein